MKQPCVYILASRPRGTLYIGVTSDLKNRIGQHKEGIMSGYASRRGATTLVWFEEYPDMNQAISREKMLKKASRYIKIKMIEEMNPEWLDLYNSLFF